MPHPISSLAQTYADLESTMYTEMYNITFSGGGSLHLTPQPPTASGNPTSFTFGGQPYTSFGLTRGTIDTKQDTTIPSMAIQFQNVDLAFGALVLDNDIRGARVTISGVLLASGTNSPISNNLADTRHIYDGKIGAIKINEETVTVQVNPGMTSITTTVPRRFYGQPDFPFGITR